MKSAIIVILFLIFIAGCGHETTQPGTWNGLPLNMEVKNSEGQYQPGEIEPAPSIRVQELGTIVLQDGVERSFMRITCGGSEETYAITGVGVFKCGTAGTVKTVAAPQRQWN